MIESGRGYIWSTNEKNYDSWFENWIFFICDVNSRTDSTIILIGIWESSQELLAKQLVGAFIKEGKENVVVADKRNFKGKTRYIWNIDPLMIQDFQEMVRDY